MATRRDSKASASKKSRRSPSKKHTAAIPKKHTSINLRAKKHTAAKLHASAPHHHGAPHSSWKSQMLADPDVRQMLINLAGEHTLHVISDFDTSMSDEEIAKKTKLRTSDVRVVLNKLHSCGLVSYSRSRDKNSGWYSYVWKMNNERARGIIEHMKTDGCAHDAIAPEGDGGENYGCPNCVEGSVPFDKASEAMFRCGQCGASLEFVGTPKK